MLSLAKPVRVVSKREDKNTIWQQFQVRHTVRCYLCDPFAVLCYWTIYDGKAVFEWLVMRFDTDGKYSYALSNAPEETEISQLAWWKCQRYFIERANFELNRNSVGMSYKLKNIERSNIIWL